MSNKLWGGRFEGKIDPGFAEFNNSQSGGYHPSRIEQHFQLPGTGTYLMSTSLFRKKSIAQIQAVATARTHAFIFSIGGCS